MFIKLVKGSEETTYECLSVIKRPTNVMSGPVANDNFANGVDLVMERSSEPPNQAFVISYDARDTDVFFMNNEGKTIQAFWALRGQATCQAIGR